MGIYLMGLIERMRSLFYRVVNFVKNVNRRRLEHRKIHLFKKQISAIALKYNKNAAENRRRPEKLANILIIDPLHCYGDALFVNGLIKSLKDEGLTVGIVTNAQLRPIYLLTVESDQIFIFEDDFSIQRCLAGAWDIAIDLCYMWNQQWSLREKIVTQLLCYKAVCDPLFLDNCSGLYSHVFDMRGERHFGDRLAKILEFCSGKKSIARIYPYLFQNAMFEYSGTSSKKIYVNTVGRVKSRCLNQHQIDQICKWADHLSNFVTYVYVDGNAKVCIRESRKIKIARTKSFLDACNLIATTSAVISPDTSIVHVASALNIPILAFYCENDREVYGRPMSEIWAPLSNKSRVVLPKCQHWQTSRIPISNITTDQIAEGLEWLKQQI